MYGLQTALTLKSIREHNSSALLTFISSGYYNYAFKDKYMDLERPRHLPQHFSEILKDKFHKRALKNQNYSLRAYSRDLGLTSGHLSDILNRKTGISLEKAKQISLKLSLSAPDENLFLTLVKMNSTSGPNIETNQILSHDSSYITLADDYYRVLTEWFYFAIVELVRVQDFQNDDNWIANRLGINLYDVRPAIERLLRVELLKDIDGELLQTYDYFISPSGTPLDTAKKFHKQILSKAIEAVDKQAIEERNFTSGFLRVRKEDLPKIGEKIKEFRRQMASEIESGEGHDCIYAFSIQFFRGDAGPR